jgi:hypothetical protein
MHGMEWEKDLASRDLDAFFVCIHQRGCVGCWLGDIGPKVDADILVSGQVNFVGICKGTARRAPTKNQAPVPANFVLTAH